jgi:hypothetical protein
MAGNLKNHRGIFYKLRRDWGLEVTLYRPITSTKDLTTGKLSRGFQIVTVKNAPVLPADVDRSFVYDLAFIAASKNFTEGGFFDRKQRSVLLDARQLPKYFEPNLNDFLVFKTQGYRIQSIQFIEEFAGYRLRVVAVENSRERWIAAKNSITFTPTASGTL